MCEIHQVEMLFISYMLTVMSVLYTVLVFSVSSHVTSVAMCGELVK